jgi:uncharacterized membrane protein
MRTTGQRSRPVWLLTAIGLVWLVIGVTNLATFSGGGPVSKWLQLGLGILGLVLAAVWLTWVARMVRARNRREVTSRP